MSINFSIPVLENTVPGVSLFADDHEMSANMNVLKKEKKKRGRPRKLPTDQNVKEEFIDDVKNEEQNVKTCFINETVEDGKRHRKVPARFSETVQVC